MQHCRLGHIGAAMPLPQNARIARSGRLVGFEHDGDGQRILIDPGDHLSGKRCPEPVRNKFLCREIEFAHAHGIAPAIGQRNERFRAVRRKLDHRRIYIPVMAFGFGQGVDVDKCLPGGLPSTERRRSVALEEASWMVGPLSDPIDEAICLRERVHLGKAAFALIARQIFGLELAETRVRRQSGSRAFGLFFGPGKRTTPLDLFQPQIRI